MAEDSSYLRALDVRLKCVLINDVRSVEGNKPENNDSEMILLVLVTWYHTAFRRSVCGG